MTLQGLLTDLDYKPQSYSGRGMYGRTCLSIPIDNPDEQWSIAYEAGRKNADDGAVMVWPAKNRE